MRSTLWARKLTCLAVAVAETEACALLHQEPLARVEFLAVSADRQLPRRGGRTVFHGPARHGDLRPRPELAWLDAGALQRRRSFGFESPGGHRAVRVLHVHEQPGVRVRVLELLDRAFNGDRLLVFEHRARMMGDHGNGSNGDRRSREQRGPKRVPHHLPPGFLSLGTNVNCLNSVAPSLVSTTALF